MKLRKTIVRRSVILAGAAFYLAFSAQADAQEDWTVIELNPSGQSSYLKGADSAQQVGFTGGTRAALWAGTASSWVNLHPPGTSQSEALAVQGGQQVGWARVGNQVHAVLWSGSAASWIDLNPPGAMSSTLYAVHGGTQVGEADTRAALWRGTAQSCEYLYHGLSWAYGIDAHQQVGTLGRHPVGRAALWTGSPLSLVILHPVEAVHSEAWAVHNGQQVGAFRDADAFDHAVLWTGNAGSWVDLTPVWAVTALAYAVHEGQQAGEASVHGTDRRAVLWRGTAASCVDLHSFLPSGATSSVATSITRNATNTYVGGWMMKAGAKAVLWKGPLPCYPDCNNDSALNLADFGCFQTAFGTGNMYADCNQDTALNLADFGCFQTRFALGCP